MAIQTDSRFQQLLSIATDPSLREALEYLGNRFASERRVPVYGRSLLGRQKVTGYQYEKILSTISLQALENSRYLGDVEFKPGDSPVISLDSVRNIYLQALRVKSTPELSEIEVSNLLTELMNTWISRYHFLIVLDYLPDGSNNNIQFRVSIAWRNGSVEITIDKRGGYSVLGEAPTFYSIEDFLGYLAKLVAEGKQPITHRMFPD